MFKIPAVDLTDAQLLERTVIVEETLAHPDARDYTTVRASMQEHYRELDARGLAYPILTFTEVAR
jgi:hypothetical protein